MLAGLFLEFGCNSNVYNIKSNTSTNIIILAILTTHSRYIACIIFIYTMGGIMIYSEIIVDLVMLGVLLLALAFFIKHLWKKCW